MGDPINVFSGGFGVKRLSPKEIAQMKKNMKRVPEIQLKSDIYHNQEITEAEKILGKIATVTPTTPPKIVESTKKHSGLKTKIYLLRQRFISLF